MTRQDIRIDPDYINAKNDLEWFASDADHIQDTIDANPGEWKEHPQDGVGILNYLSSSGQQAAIGRKTIIQLQSDLYPCDNPQIGYDATGKLIVNPNIELP